MTWNVKLHKRDLLPHITSKETITTTTTVQVATVMTMIATVEQDWITVVEEVTVEVEVVDHPGQLEGVDLGELVTTIATMVPTATITARGVTMTIKGKRIEAEEVATMIAGTTDVTTDTPTEGETKEPIRRPRRRRPIVKPMDRSHPLHLPLWM